MLWLQNSELNDLLWGAKSRSISRFPDLNILLRPHENMLRLILIEHHSFLSHILPSLSSTIVLHDFTLPRISTNFIHLIKPHNVVVI